MQTPADSADSAALLEGRAPRKIVCLETYWGDHRVRVFQNTSVRPFLDALSMHFDPPLRIAHRFVASSAQLVGYTRFPDGLLWQDPEVFDTPFYYLSFHGSPGRLRSSLQRIGARALCGAFEKWGGQYPNLVYFGACSVFAGRTGRKFAREFLAASGCRAIVGYTTDIDWIDSMIIDMLFVRRFFADPDPWTNLKQIHQSVLDDFAPARRLGYVLITAPRPVSAVTHPDHASPQSDIASPQSDIALPQSDIALPQSDIVDQRPDEAPPQSNVASPQSNSTALQPTLTDSQPTPAISQPALAAPPAAVTPP